MMFIAPGKTHCPALIRTAHKARQTFQSHGKKILYQLPQATTASSLSGTKEEAEGKMLPAALLLLVAMEVVGHCSATQSMSPVSPEGNHIIEKVSKGAH